jgi:hypothetical protein
MGKGTRGYVGLTVYGTGVARWLGAVSSLLVWCKGDLVSLQHALAVAASLDIERGNALKPIKLLALTKYGRLGASSRLRSLQYVPWLQDADVLVTVQSLLPDAVLQARYRRGTYRPSQLLSSYISRIQSLRHRHQFDVVWIEKEALPWMPLWLEAALLTGTPYVLDFDDAIFLFWSKAGWPHGACCAGGGGQ